MHAFWTRMHGFKRFFCELMRQHSGGPSNFDGQGSGSDFLGNVLPHLHVSPYTIYRLSQSLSCSSIFTFAQVHHPSFGYVNSCDGGRSHLYCDVRMLLIFLAVFRFSFSFTAHLICREFPLQCRICLLILSRNALCSTASNRIFGGA